MKKFGIYLFLSLIALNISSQVTIGSKDVPNTGALLDLKEWQQSDGGVNSTKGLMLPRVDLIKNDLTSLGVSADVGGHEGVLVYNVTSNDGLCPGLHVWDSKSWVRLDPLESLQEPKIEELDNTTGLGTLTDRDGITYRVAKFGDDWWMTENLATKTLQNHCGKIVPIVPYFENTRSTPQYVYPDNNSGSPREYGLLYNWAAATNKKGGENGGKVFPDESETGGVNTEVVGVKGICPEGWHLPSDLEWNRLEAELSNYPSKYGSGYGIVGEWKAEFNTLTSTPRGQHQQILNSFSGPTLLNPGFSKSAADGGFDVLSVGRFGNAVVTEYGLSAAFWTSSAVGDKETASWFRLINNSLVFGVARVSGERRLLHSVRCKKD